jgi:hypothetical protein
MWKRINRTKDHTFSVGSLSSLLGTKCDGLWSEEEGGGDGQVKKGRGTDCSMGQFVDEDLAEAGAQPRLTQ